MDTTEDAWLPFYWATRGNYGSGYWISATLRYYVPRMPGLALRCSTFARLFTLRLVPEQMTSKSRRPVCNRIEAA